MNTSEFISNLKEELELESELTPETVLNELEEWDSMAVMILIGFVSDNFGIILNGDDITKLTNVNSLIEKIGKEKFN